MDDQMWSGFVDSFTAALRQSISIDAFFSYKIEQNYDTSQHYFGNLSNRLVDQYLTKMQPYDPLNIQNNRDSGRDHILVLSQHNIPEEYADFNQYHQIGDNVELYFSDQHTPIRGISLIRTQAHGLFNDQDLLVLKSVYHLADYHFQQNIQAKVALSPAQLQAFHITKKQFEVIRLICQGKDNQQIAMALFISVSTVKTHIQHIFQKLAVQNKAQLLSKLMQLHNE